MDKDMLVQQQVLDLSSPAVGALWRAGSFLKVKLKTCWMNKVSKGQNISTNPNDDLK